MSPTISILLPTHNRPDTLRLAIESVLAQTVRDFEVLVVGDGCTDDTGRLVEGFGDPRLRWFDLPKAPNFGYANRNLALKEARGLLIAFMAHDDLWFPDHLERLSATFADERIDLVYSMPLWEDPAGYLTPTPFNLHDPELRRHFLERRHNLLPAANVVHRRTCFDRIGYWNDTLPSCGDWDMWARIIESGGEECFRYLPTPTCLHFRAVWRRNPIREPLGLLEAFQTRHLYPYWSERLRIDCNGAALEQEPTWHTIHDGGPTWLERLRQDVACFLDRRNVAIDDHHADWCRRQAALEAEALNLRTTLFDGGYEARAFSHTVSFEGFLKDGGVTWLGRTSTIRIARGDEAPRAVIDLVGLCREDYQCFPFDVHVYRDDVPIRSLRFSRSRQRHRIRVDLDDRTTLRFESTSTLLANERSVMLMSLYVGAPLAFSLYRWCRRGAARLLKDE